MSSGFEAKISDPNANYWLNDSGGRRIELAFNFPTGYTRPAVTTLEYQFIKTDKFDPSVSALQTKANCTALTALTDAIGARGSAIWAAPTTDPMSNILYMDIDWFMLWDNNDYVTVSVWDPAEPTVRAQRQIQVIRPFEYAFLQERNGLTSQIGNLNGGSPANKEYMVVFSSFYNSGSGGGPITGKEFGPEIIGALLESRKEPVENRFSLRILGSYYYNHTTNVISQVRGICGSIGILPGDLSASGVDAGSVFNSVSSENGQTVSGYTFIVDAPTNRLNPVSITDLVVVFDDNIPGYDGNDFDIKNYEGAVWFDQNSSNAIVLNGDTGTPKKPINNITATVELLTNTGLSKVNVSGELSVTSSEDFINKELVGIDGSAKFWGDSSGSIAGTRFRNLRMLIDSIPVSTANAVIDNCICEDLFGFNGEVIDSAILGGGELSSYNGLLRVYNCHNPNKADVKLDYLNNSARLVGWKGNLKVTDGDAVLDVHMQGGRLTLDATITGGTINVTGFGVLTDNSVNPTVNSDDFFDTSAGVNIVNNAGNKTTIAEGVWDAARASHVSANSFGENVNADLIKIAGSAQVDTVSISLFSQIILAYTSGNFKVNFPTDGDVTFYKQDGTTVLYKFAVTSTDRTRI